MPYSFAFLSFFLDHVSIHFKNLFLANYFLQPKNFNPPGVLLCIFDVTNSGLFQPQQVPVEEPVHKEAEVDM